LRLLHSCHVTSLASTPEVCAHPSESCLLGSGTCSGCPTASRFAAGATCQICRKPQQFASWRLVYKAWGLATELAPFHSVRFSLCPERESLL
jgi:hypothetical protein